VPAATVARATQRPAAERACREGRERLACAPGAAEDLDAEGLQAAAPAPIPPTITAWTPRVWTNCGMPQPSPCPGEATTREETTLPAATWATTK